LAVIVVPILDVFFKGKILKQQELAAVVLACFGVGLLELGPSGGLHITSGDLLAFSQTIFFGIGYWRLESVSHAYPHHAARLTVGLLLAVAVGSALYALVEFGLGHIAPSVDQFIGWLGDPFILCALVWTGLVSTALALYLETVSLKVVSASELTLLMTTISLWGAAFAYVTIGEVLTPTGLLGGFLILGGCVVGNLSPKTKNKQSLPVFREYDEG
jgi:drug/metabolite transporter (DMT)-like permease